MRSLFLDIEVKEMPRDVLKCQLKRFENLYTQRLC